MLRRKIALILALVLVAFGAISAVGQSASAQRLIGCDSLLNWPCPGPVP